MVAIEHRQKSSTTSITPATINVAILSPTSSASSASAASSTATTTTTSSLQHQQQPEDQQLDKEKQHLRETAKMSNSESPAEADKECKAATTTTTSPTTTLAGAVSKSAVSQRNVDIKIAKKTNTDATSKELTKKVLKLDLTGKELDEYSMKSPKSPIAARLPHQTSLTSSVDVEDRKTLREALYQGIFHRHRRTIFAVGSFLRMLRSRNSQYNTIRSSSEGEDVEEVR